MPRLRGREIHVLHGVAFPHVSVPAEGLGPEAPRARILDALDLQGLEGWVRRCLASADRVRSDLPPLGPDGVEAIVDAIAVRRALRLHTPTLAARVEERLGELTDEQFDVLTMLAALPRARITGGPGTGKTLLAVEAARRFAAQGLSALLVCFNAPLGGFLARATEGTPGLTATHFHELCRRLAAEAGLDARRAAAETAEGYEHVFPELLLAAAERLGRRYDAIVVDEAQDFRETWWAALEGCLREGSEGNLYLFEDAEQTLTEGAPTLRPSGLVGPFSLTRDCRNPTEIHDFLAACPGGPKHLRGSGVSTGIRPRLAWAGEAGKVPRQVSSIVARLVKDWAVPPEDIVVLTPRAAPKSALGKVERLGPAPVSWRERASPAHVLVDTVHRFKGLEARAVVLAEISPDVRPDLATCLRIGCSRPTVHLDLLVACETAPSSPRPSRSPTSPDPPPGPLTAPSAALEPVLSGPLTRAFGPASPGAWRDPVMSICS